MDDSDIVNSVFDEIDGSDYFSPAAVYHFTPRLLATWQLLTLTETQSKGSSPKSCSQKDSCSQESGSTKGSTQKNVTNNSEACEKTSEAHFR